MDPVNVCMHVCKYLFVFKETFRKLHIEIGTNQDCLMVVRTGALLPDVDRQLAFLTEITSTR